MNKFKRLEQVGIKKYRGNENIYLSKVQIVGVGDREDMYFVANMNIVYSGSTGKWFKEDELDKVEE